MVMWCFLSLMCRREERDRDRNRVKILKYESTKRLKNGNMPWFVEVGEYDKGLKRKVISEKRIFYFVIASPYFLRVWQSAYWEWGSGLLRRENHRLVGVNLFAMTGGLLRRRKAPTSFGRSGKWNMKRCLDLSGWKKMIKVKGSPWRVGVKRWNGKGLKFIKFRYLLIELKGVWWVFYVFFRDFDNCNCVEKDTFVSFFVFLLVIISVS